MSEINVNWTNVPFSQRLYERSRHWWEFRHCIVAHNSQDKETDTFQQGGVGILTRGPIIHRINQSTADPIGLGRWCSTRLRGQGGLHLRIISAYRPVQNMTGPTSVYNQHRRFYLTAGRDGCPRELFLSDLEHQLRQWIDEGDRIILGIDANEDLRRGDFKTRLLALGLREVILQKHGIAGPPTYQRGQRPIDGLFMSDTLPQVPCGYLGFGDGLISDHRPLWADVPLQWVTGALSINKHPSIRRLQCRDPRIVDRYLSCYRRELHNQKLGQRAQQLVDQMSIPLTPEQQSEWEFIDSQRTVAMMKAERSCRKLRMGAVPWSPNLQRAIETITYWQLHLKRHRGGKVSSRRLARLRRSIQEPLTPSSMETILTALRQAYAHYREVKRAASTLRHTWLEDLASARAEALGGSYPSILKQLQYRERQRSEARTCRHALGRIKGGSVLTVHTTGSDGSIHECVTKHEIEAACMKENVSRFQQAQSTPFLMAPLSLWVDYAAKSPFAQRLRDGGWTDQLHLDPSIAQVLHAFQRPPEAAANPISTQISVDDHAWKWSRSREYTATGKSGLHFGHFMAGSRCPEVSQFETTMAQIPFASGYAPKRWCQGLDLAILKKPDSFHVETLRTILLLEPDFNVLNKILAQRVMHNAENLDLLAGEQFGSRRHKSAAELATNKRLTFDLARQSRQPLAFCSLDAKSCYDRIVWPIASLALQRLGAPIEPIEMMLSTLQKMRHYIRTIHGTSTEFYDAASYPSFHGVGQGNGAAPAIWAAVSSPLLNLQRDLGFAAQFRCPLSAEELCLAGFAFVDDTDLCLTPGPHDSPEQLLQKLQRSVDQWSTSLTVTGGALVPAKSFWAHINFIWKDGRWGYDTTQKGLLSMTDSQGHRHAVEQIRPDEGRRTLGVRLSPDGNNKDEFSHLRQCSESWANKMKQSRLPRHLVWHSLTRHLWPRLAYPLPATTLTRKQCEQIMAPALQIGLSGSGVVRTFPRAIVHASPGGLGLNLPHLYDLQGLSQLTLVMRHVSSPRSIMGKLLRCSIQHLTLELGLPGTPFHHNYEQVGCLATETLIKSLWHFLWENDLSLEVDTPVLPLHREQDRHLMQAFLGQGYSKGDLSALNRCRIFLQVTTLSDISSGCGRYITNKAREGIPEVDIPRPEGWPRQGRPSKTDWSVWRRALSELCQHSPQFILPNQLGPWTTDTPLHEWLWSPQTNRLYRQITPHHWVFHQGATSRTGRSTGSRFNLQAHPVPEYELPQGLLRGRASIQGKTIHSSGFAPNRAQSPAPSVPSLLQAIQLSSRGTEWVFPDCCLEATESELQVALSAQKAMVISDGSYRRGSATASWILSSCSGLPLARGALHTPGSVVDLSPLRAELSGIYAAILAVERITSHLALTQVEVTIGSDSTSALRQSFSSTPPSLSRPNYDLLSAIHRFRQDTVNYYRPHFVRAHQDLSVFGPLDLWAHFNIQADVKAKAYHNEVRSPELRDARISGEAGPLMSQRKKFTTFDRATLYQHISNPKGREYWEKKKQIPNDISPQIAWDAISMASSELPTKTRLRITKLISGHLATGRRMKLYHQWSHDHCPRCGISETTDHVTQCQDPTVTGLWADTIRDLRDWLDTRDTHPSLRDLLLAFLTTWSQAAPMSIPDYLPEEVYQLATSQSKLSTGALLSGFFLQQWAEIQHQHLLWMGKTMTGVRWLTQIIRKLWDIAWDFWDHRNSVLHKTKGQHDQEVDRQISEQYAQGWQFLPAAHRRWFERPLPQLLLLPLRHKRAWLRHAEILRQRSEQSMTAEIRRGRQLMHQWLTSAPSID